MTLTTWNALFVYWNLLGDMKLFVIKSIVRSAMISAADTILSLYPVLLMYISYKCRLTITWLFWSVLLLQTGYCAFKIASFDWAVGFMRDRKRVLVNLAAKQAISLVDRLKNDASHTFICSEERAMAHVHLARSVVALRHLITIVYTVPNLFASMLCIAIISANFSILCAISMILIIAYTPGWITWNVRAKFHESHRVALHTYSTVMHDVFARLDDRYKGAENMNEFIEGVTDSLSEAIANKHVVAEKEGIAASVSLAIVMAVLFIITLFISLSNFQYFVYTVTWFACSYWRFNENALGLLSALESYSEVEFDFGELELLYRETSKRTIQITHSLNKDFTLLFRALEFYRGSFTLRQTDDVIMGAGDIVLIDGNLGSGKSTLIDIITAVIQPGKLDAYLDGNALPTGFSELQSNIVICKCTEKPYVACDIYSFIGGENADHGKVIQCLRTAEVSVEFLDREICREISDGEWQCLLIAQCLYNNSRIMIFDEVDANIDVTTAIAIFNNITRDFPSTLLLVTTRSAELKRAIGTQRLLIDSGGVINFSTISQ
jgi:ABC-type cobalamin/Fe3+-siderophores transport system ATPase subunit